MRARVLFGAIIVIAILIVSVAYYVSLSRVTPVRREPTEATLVPTLVFAQATVESDAQANAMTRLGVDDISASGLGLNTKLFVGDSGTTIYVNLYTGLEAGGYNAFDVGYSWTMGTSERLADPTLLLARGLSRYGNHSFNYAGYNNSQYDQLYNLQVRETDPARRKFMVDWIIQNYVTNAPTIPIGFPVSMTAIIKDRVSGAIPYGEESLGNIWTFQNATSLVGSDTLNVAVIQEGEGDVTPETYNIFTYAIGSTGLQAMMMNGLYDNLLKSRPDGSVVPSLATGWKILNSTNIIVQLRNGVKWTDGAPVTPQDVAFSFNYIIKNNQPGIMQPFVSSVDHVIVLNSTAVQFVLKSPYVPFITNTLAKVPIIPQHIWDGLLEKQGVKNPSDLKLTTDMMVGSGPWMLAKWQYGTQIVFERNPDYFIQPHYRYIRYVYFTSRGVANTALEQGQVDILPSHLALSPTEIQELNRYPSIQIVKIPTWGLWTFLLNIRHLPFADRAFRLALAHVINYDKIVNVVFGGNIVRGAGWLALINTAWADPPLQNQVLKTIYNYNLTTAKKILTDAGYQWDSQGRLHYPESLLSKGLTAIQLENYNYKVPVNEVISTIATPQPLLSLQFSVQPPQPIIAQDQLTVTKEVLTFRNNLNKN